MNDIDEKSNFDILVDHLEKVNAFKTAVKKPVKYTQVYKQSDIKRDTFFISDVDDDLTIISQVEGREKVENILKKGDVILVGSEGEQCIISVNNFFKIYNVVNGVATPRHEPRNVAHITAGIMKKVFGKTDPVKYISAFNKEVVLQVGDYLIQDPDNPDMYHSSSSDVFQNVYMFPKKV